MYGDIVREARTSRGLTQTELSNVSGIDQPNISAIEAGRRLPSAATLHQLLLCCGYELVAIAGERVIRFPADPEDVAGDVAASEPIKLTKRQRVAAVVAALDASEAIVRARR